MADLIPLFDGRNATRKVFCVACAALVAGCSNIDYPTDWAPVQPAATTCPDLTGTYDDIGSGWRVISGGNPIKEVPRLDNILIPDVPSSASHLTIQGPKDGLLKISAWSHKQWLANRDLVENTDFSCESGWLKVPDSFAAGLPPLFLGGSHGANYLSLAQDGALISRGEEKGAMIWLMIPPVVISDVKTWGRFPVYAKGAESSKPALAQPKPET